MIPFVEHARHVYVAAAITGLRSDHPLRQTVVHVIRTLKSVGYEVMTEHMLHPNQEDMIRDIAGQLSVSFDHIRAHPELISDDFDLVRLRRARWCVADVTVPSFGVGAELQVAWERLRVEAFFPALVVAQEGVVASRIASAFIGRFLSRDHARVYGYRDTPHAVHVIARFVNEVVAPRFRAV